MSGHKRPRDDEEEIDVDEAVQEEEDEEEFDFDEAEREEQERFDHARRFEEVLRQCEEAGPYERPKPPSGRSTRKRRGEPKAKDTRRNHSIASMLISRKPIELVGANDVDLLMFQGGSVPNLTSHFESRDRSMRHEITINLMERLRDRDEAVILSWGCGAGKSFRIFELLELLLEQDPTMPVLFVSCRRIHADDLLCQLERLGFTSYLDEKEKTAAGMASRITGAEYKRIICSIQSVRALPPVFIDAFRGRRRDRPGLVVYDELTSIAAYVQAVGPNENASMKRPDVQLTRLAYLSEKAMVLAACADSFVHGGAVSFLRRVAPHKKIDGVCATEPQLKDRTTRLAFDHPQEKGKDNLTKQAYFDTLYLAVDAAIHLVDDRVLVVCATKKQMQDVKRRLCEHKLWSESGCKMYYGGSKNMDDFKDTATSWLGVYLVLVTACCTVAINIAVRFGSCFMLTCKNGVSALLRDQLQTVVRIWRKAELEPLPDGFNKGKCIINVLLDCLPPQKVESVEMKDVLQKRYESEIKQLQMTTSTTRTAYSEAGKNESGFDRFIDTHQDTLPIMAWNSVERALQETHHFRLFLHLARYPTRDFDVERLHPPQGDRLSLPVMNCEGEGGEEGMDEEREVEDLYDIDKSDKHLRSLLDDPRLVYLWFIDDFRAWHIEREGEANFKNRFFNESGRLPELRYRGNGITRQALETVFYELKNVGCFPEPVPEQETPAPEPPCSFEIIKKRKNALARYAHARCFTKGELVKMPQYAQNGVQVHDLGVLNGVEGLLALLQLEMSDVLGAGVGSGWSSWSEAPDNGKLVPWRESKVDLDFTPRSDDSNGCGQGRWAYAVDLHEELEVSGKTSERDLTPIQRHAKRAKSIALSLVKQFKIKTGPNLSLFAYLNALLKALYHVDIVIDTKNGKKKNGVRSNSIIKSLSVCHEAGSLLPRWHVPTSVLGGSGWVAASRIRDIDDTPAQTIPEDEPAIHTSSMAPFWDGCETNGIVSRLLPPPAKNRCVHKAQINVAKATDALKRLSDTKTETGVRVRDALALTLSAAKEGQLLQSSAYELDGKVGARRPVSNSLASMPFDAVRSLLDGSYLASVDPPAHGCLLIRLVQCEAVALCVQTPKIKELIDFVEGLNNKQQTWKRSQDIVFTGWQRDDETPIDSLRRLARDVHGLSRERHPLLDEARSVAMAALKSKRWGEIARAMANKRRGSREEDKEEVRKKAEEEAWKLICNSLVDQLLIEVEDELGDNVLSVDGHKPDWVKLIVKGKPPQEVNTKLIGRVQTRAKLITALPDFAGL